MRIASGVTDQYIYFAALDVSNAPLVGYAAKMTVKRSRNGGALAAYTTPTINATDTGAGGYELLIDEDTTIDAGDFTQEYYVRIKDTGAHMVPVRRTIELFRPAGGDTGKLNVNVTHWGDSGVAGGTGGRPTVNAGSIADTGMNERFDVADTGAIIRAIYEAPRSRLSPRLCAANGGSGLYVPCRPR